jgi:diguanylate cyclase
MYIQGVALQELGRHREAMTVALDMLEELDPALDPFWRAKGLALLAESSASVGELNRALDALAEGQWLVASSSPGSYQHLSASMAVALALRAVYLFEEADDLLTEAHTGDDPDVELLVLQEATLLRAGWGATLELVGHVADAGQHYVVCAQRALRMGRVAALVGDEEMCARARVIESFAVHRLGGTALAGARVREAMGHFRMRDELVETHLVHLVLGAACALEGAFDEAHRHLASATQGAQRAGRDVWTGTATTATADVAVAEHGRHPAVALWKRLARTGLQRVWQEREGRFAALRDRNRLRELAAETDRMGRAVLEDPLTGLGNRRMLVASVEAAGTELSVVFVDVDRFKDVNDRFSHAVGDEVLQRLAMILRTQCRSEDVVIRYGGDEFVVLVLSDSAAADGIAHRLHEAVRSARWHEVAVGLEVSVSVGVARSVPASAALAAADAALHAAKRAGRDRVVSA